MKNIVFLKLLIFLIVSTYACKVNRTSVQDIVFSNDIKGFWNGNLCIYSNSGNYMEIPMSLSIVNTDMDSILTWTITYDNQAPRKYKLHILNLERGMYQIDELNGIIIPAMQKGTELITNYEVAGNHMTVIYDLLSKNNLLFKVNMWRSSNGKLTGDMILGNDTIPKVTTFLPTTYQIAKLKRVR